MKVKKLISVLLSACFAFTMYANNTTTLNNISAETSTASISYDNIPDYSNVPYVSVNDNQPYFTSSEMTTEPFEIYSDLDSLGRCGTAYANICDEIMPTEERGDISSIEPTGWHSVTYDCVEGGYLYNRCHLIGFQLAGENANKENLITGTRYMNVDGMLPFENMVADYVEETDNHVLYRVTPEFEGNNLVADGVLMEAYSVEDEGEGICYNVYCYNVQPGIEIFYEDGESQAINSISASIKGDVNGDSTLNLYDVIEIAKYIMNMRTFTSSQSTLADYNSDGDINLYDAIAISKNIMSSSSSNNNNNNSDVKPSSTTYILNTKSKKFHLSTCGSASKISAENKDTYTGSRADLISMGYSPCGNCDP